jgi:hypothetical protein
MKIYIHRDGHPEPDALETQSTAVLGEALSKDDGGVSVALLEDSDELLDLAVSVEAAGVQDKAHVFAGTRHRVQVEVLYNGESREHEFSASMRVERVFKWAVGKQGFDLSHADAVEHTLALCASGKVPSDDEHLGSLDAETPGKVCFMLIAKHRFEG